MDWIAQLPDEESDPDMEDLRQALTDYYGTAMVSGFPAAAADLGRLDEMSDEELQEEARRNGIRI